MRIIAKSAIDHYVRLHPTAKESLYSWYKLIKTTQFSNFNQLRATFPSADIVKNKQGNNLTVFNVGGNKVRLCAAIHYSDNTDSKLYIRHILTHSEYDKNEWKN